MDKEGERSLSTISLTHSLTFSLSLSLSLSLYIYIKRERERERERERDLASASCFGAAVVRDINGSLDLLDGLLDIVGRLRRGLFKSGHGGQRLCNGQLPQTGDVTL